MDFKDFLNTPVQKEVPFMGKKIKINKLSVDAVLSIQERAREAAKKTDATDEDSLEMLKHVITQAVPGVAEVSEEDFRKLPLDELTKLSNSIMEWSGLGNAIKE